MKEVIALVGLFLVCLGLAVWLDTLKPKPPSQEPLLQPPLKEPEPLAEVVPEAEMRFLEGRNTFILKGAFVQCERCKVEFTLTNLRGMIKCPRCDKDVNAK